jgi:CspA family cold shock protein
MQKHSAENTDWLKGTVHWFDNTSGEGIIKDSEGQSFFVHYSAIESNSSWKSLEDKQKVKFKLVKDCTFAQVSHVKGVK